MDTSVVVVFLNVHCVDLIRWRNVLENLDHQEKLGVFGFDNVHSLRSASTAMLRWNSRFQKMKSLPAKVADRLPGWLTG